MDSLTYDVIVVGGGHAGSEAAGASARMGAKTLLLTHNIDSLGQLSCNPAIGGIGKGHLVSEISAMGGLMPLAADASAIHLRTLNASKGEAVRATRTQADRQVYRVALRKHLENTPNLELFQASVEDLLLENGVVKGVKTQMGLAFFAPTVVLTTGTFLNGRLHMGRQQASGGRAGDEASLGLAEFLSGVDGLSMGRLKTGTPPRLKRSSIDFSNLEPQPSDGKKDFYFNHWATNQQLLPHVDCFITHTNKNTHAIIQQHLGESPMVTGDITGKGPRYCPSIEDKIKRFESQNAHQIFLEIEGLSVEEVYPNGISTSLPFHAQQAMIASIKGLEKAIITRPGYAIEYDFINPQGLYPWLESKFVGGLFLAGQINGTTGYEEAGVQGLLAGCNAALKSAKRSPWYLGRSEAYLGDLVYDLIALGTTEPYRMFTSRAEYRLMLREANAQERLTPKAYELGLIDHEHWQLFQATQQQEAHCQQQIKTIKVSPGSREANLLSGQIEGDIRETTPLEALLGRKGLSADLIVNVYPELGHSRRALEKVITDTRYAGYIRRQQEEVARISRDEALVIPSNFDYLQITGLSSESLEKLLSARPHTLGQLSRLAGITPACVSLVRVFLKKKTTLTS